MVAEMTLWQQKMQELIDAMVVAEGGEQAFIRAVQCSIPHVTDYPTARQVAYNSIMHASWDQAMKDPGAFITFLGSRWCPVGAANDPHHLNQYWVQNVQNAYHAQAPRVSDLRGRGAAVDGDSSARG
jgi:hypothetical protein